MSDLNIWQWLIVLVVMFVLIVLPWTMIMHKAGYNRWWSILFVIPGLGVVALWVFALARWPNERRGVAPTTRRTRF